MVGAFGVVVERKLDVGTPEVNLGADAARVGGAVSDGGDEAVDFGLFRFHRVVDGCANLGVNLFGILDLFPRSCRCGTWSCVRRSRRRPRRA